MSLPPKVNVTSVSDGLAKLIRDVRLLQKEVRDLHGTLKGFAGERHRRWMVLPPEAGGSERAQPKTDEPQSKILEVRYEYGENPNLEVPTRTLLAIAKEIDGAIRDIRAARADIAAISDDSDLREAFKEWQSHQK